VKTQLVRPVVVRVSSPIYFHRELIKPQWGRRLCLRMKDRELWLNVGEDEFQAFTGADKKYGEVMEDDF
jgi:hypothetical protein